VRTLFAKWFAAVLLLLLGSAAGLWIGHHQEMATATVTSAFHEGPSSIPSSTPKKALSERATLTLAVASATPSEASGVSAGTFDEKAAELLNQAGRAFLAATQRYPWKTNIVTTVFWIGGKGSEESVWDENWTNHYGGLDNPDPSARHNYIPTALTPKQNPFYCALPYNDLAEGKIKPEAPLIIPWFKKAYAGADRSVCWHRWLAIRKGDRTCYAQWEDCGPVLIDHFRYVFGEERPNPNLQRGAGLNVSPAVRDYLGLQPTDTTDWQFVEVGDVPPGPWRDYGENNPFVMSNQAQPLSSLSPAVAPSP